MSISIRLTSSALYLDEDMALEAVKNADELLARIPRLTESDSLAEIFDLWNLEITRQGDGSLQVRSLGDLADDEEDLLRCIAPLVRDGGEVEALIEDGEGPGTIIKIYRFSGGKLSVSWQYEQIDEKTGKPTRLGYDPDSGEVIAPRSGKRGTRSALSDSELVSRLSRDLLEKVMAVGRFRRPVSDTSVGMEKVVVVAISLHNDEEVRCWGFADIGHEQMLEIYGESDNPEEEAKEIMQEISSEFAEAEPQWLSVE